MTVLDKPLVVIYHEANAFVLDNIVAVLIGLLVFGVLWKLKGKARILLWPWEKAMATIAQEKAERLAMGEYLGDLLITAVSDGKLTAERAIVWHKRLSNIFTVPIENGEEPLKDRLKKAEPEVEPRKRNVLQLRTV